jgi:hypothetical protein
VNKLEMDDLLFRCMTEGLDRSGDPDSTRRYWELCDKVFAESRDVYERLMRISWRRYMGPER